MVDGHEVVLNNKETSILTFLALHPTGIARDDIIAALWTNPDGTNNGSAETFRSTVYHARTRIRAATGEPKKMYIANRGTRYLLNPADITTDLTRFAKHLDTANRTHDKAERITALETAIDTYRGHLVTGMYAWYALKTASAAGPVDADVVGVGVGKAELLVVVEEGESVWFSPGFEVEFEPPHPANAAQLTAVLRTATI